MIEIGPQLAETIQNIAAMSMLVLVSFIIFNFLKKI